MFFIFLVIDFLNVEFEFLYDLANQTLIIYDVYKYFPILKLIVLLFISLATFKFGGVQVKNLFFQAMRLVPSFGTLFLPGVWNNGLVAHVAVPEDHSSKVLRSPGNSRLKQFRALFWPSHACCLHSQKHIDILVNSFRQKSIFLDALPQDFLFSRKLLSLCFFF